MECCSEHHPDHSKLMHRVNRIAGQVGGIGKMIEGRRYCPEVMIQIEAVRTALGSLQDALLETHLKECVSEAFTSKDRSVAEKKMSELLELFSRRRS